MDAKGYQVNAPLLKVRDLSRRFGGLVAVSKLTFDIAPGEIVGLIGPNGAGKSTAFLMIGGVIVPSGGTVEFAGRNITGMRAGDVAIHGLARTFQSTSTYPAFSVAENVRRGMLSRIRPSIVHCLMRRRSELLAPEDAEKEVDRILEIVGMQAWRDWPAGSLAYGLQKKLGIAVALASSPRLLLLDEPAAGLNHEECNELSRLLKQLRDDLGLTLFLVEHHMAMVMGLCHRVVVLVHGKKIAEGTPAEIQQNSAVIEAYLGAPEYAHA